MNEGKRVGQVLGNYRLVKLLGTGAFAEVYLGEHMHLNTRAAIKVLSTRPTDQADFLTEARTIAHLDHSHIVRVLDYGLQDGMPFLVMNYAPHGSLRQRFPRGQAAPLGACLIFIKQMADALQYAHSQGRIHRDVKPENMLLDGRDNALLSDFGISVIALDTRTQEIAGTGPYMAPEQIEGRAQFASDQYALGIVTYEWLTGERPFQGSFLSLSYQHLMQTPPPLRVKVPSISPAVERVVLTALAKEPTQRFGSVQAFAYALEQLYQMEQAASAPQGLLLSRVCQRCGTLLPQGGQYCLRCGQQNAGPVFLQPYSSENNLPATTGPGVVPEISWKRPRKVNVTGIIVLVLLIILGLASWAYVAHGP